MGVRSTVTAPDLPSGVRSAGWIVWSVAGLVGAAVLAVFAAVLGAEFLNFDDLHLYVQNPGYQGLDGAHLAWCFRSTRLGHYAPLTWISAAIDHELFGLDPRAFHRTNLVLHGANAALFVVLAVALVRRAARRSSGEHPVALALACGAAGLLFALHPLRVESVAWITERRGLLGAFFLLLALLAWLRSVAPGRPALASRGAYALSLIALTASLLSKGLGMTFVALVLVLDVYPLARLPSRVRDWTRRELRPVWLQKLPPLGLCLASAAVSSLAARSAGETVRTLSEWGVVERLAQAAYGLVYYLRQTLWPSALCPLHELPYRLDLRAPRYVAALVLVPILALGVGLARRRAPALAAAAASYAILLAPVLGFAQAGPQLVADRYSYFACMPWAVLAAAALFAAFRGPARIAAGTAALVLAGLLAASSRREIVHWHDSRALWSRVLEVGEPSSIAHNNLGTMDGEAGRYDSAIAHLRAAVAVRPDQGRAWWNLGFYLAQQDRVDEAVAAYLEARKHLRPAHEALVELGHLYLNRLDRAGEAVAVLREAVAEVESLDRSRFSPFPYLGLGVALLRTGETEEGRRRLEFAARFEETRDRARQALRALRR